MYKTTIITSVYNGDIYIPFFLDNITKQTVFKECELYLLDANSPGNEYEVVKRYQERFPNIRYERLDEDPGIYACWNYMIRNSDSKYITNANLDDSLAEDSIEKHVALLDSKPDIDVVYCYNSTVKEFGIKSCGKKTPVFPTDVFSYERLLTGNLPHNHPVWRRSLHANFGYFAEEFRSAADWEFWLRCASRGTRMELIPEVLGVYFQNPEGMSTKNANMRNNLLENEIVRNRYAG